MSPPRQKRLLVFINPHSGKGQGLKVFNKSLKPLLDAKRLTFQTVVTEFAGHAREFVLSAELSLYSGIVSISGDGLVHEIYNGLYDRPDWDEVCRFPVGLIPGGSGCALNCSLLKELDHSLETLNQPGMQASAENCAAGAELGLAATRPLDMIEMDLEKEGRKVISFFGATFGAIADSDIGSEWMRSLGQIRSYIYMAMRILCPKPYTLRISWLPLKLDSNGKPIPVSTTDKKLTLPPLSEPVPINWVTEETEYHFVYALNLSLLDAATNLAPDSKVGDGIMWMVLVRNSMSYFKLIRWFIDPSEGPDTTDPGLDAIPIRAFRIEPVHPLNGYLSLDAESFVFGAIQGQLIPQKARLMAAKK